FAAEYPFESHWAEVSGQVLHFVDEGSGPVLLMVHGNPTWSFAWRHLVAEFRSQFRVIAVDHLGCGFSSRPQADVYTLAGHIDRLSKLVALLDLQNVTLIAHDWGGAIGMGCAASQPERFRQFVLMNTAAFRNRRIPLRIAVCRIPVLGTLALRGLNLFSLAALKMAVEKPLSPAARRGLLAPYTSWARRIAVREFVRDIPMAQDHRSYNTLLEVEESLEQFRHFPVLLIWGMKDWCFTPEFLHEFQTRFPAAEIHEISDAGHYVFEDAGAEVGDRLRLFLNRE
ncbi:MAG: alpha/beta fold hydrolase, partial [Planctomycetaceae bacterium]|nr:alpha/beta fold hydrolase [Planctomycetaceae bacterium]